MVPHVTRTIVIDGRELTAEAMLNNCSELWSAVVRAGTELVASAAGSSAEGALTTAIERARASAVAVR